VKDALRAADPLRPRRRARGRGAALEAVFEARRGGAVRDLFDLAARVDAKRVNKAVFEALVQCGAFDSTLAERGVTRARAFASIDVALERSRAASRDREAGQTNLFGLFDAAPKARRRRRARATTRSASRGTGASCSCASGSRSASTSRATRSSGT
jgi:DNA polymerase-3 subunit alpha